MKKTLLAVAALLSLSPLRVNAAQPITVDKEGIQGMLLRNRMYHARPAQDTLDDMASGECSASECFDGRPILRREPPLVILEEEKVAEYFQPPYWEHQHRRYHCHGGRYHGGDCFEYGDRSPIYHPGRVVTTMKQTVGIEDRETFVGQKKTKGALFGLMGGGILGGLLAFLVNPLLGVGVLAAGVVGGYFKGKHDGETQPKVFERTETYERITGN